MKCFVHQATDAVGVCRACGRGLCAECAVDLPVGLTCAGKCEKVVEDRAARESGTAVTPADRTARIVAACLLLAVGLSMAGMCVGAFRGLDPFFLFAGLVAVVFTFFGIIFLILWTVQR